jgi:Flp pilus assembly protein TadD
VAQVRWTGRDTVELSEPQGAARTLTSRGALTVVAGDLSVTLRVVETPGLSRFALWSPDGWLPWFVVVCGLSVLTSQVEVFVENLCPWFGVNCPVAEEAGGGQGIDAEYLARLIRRDYAGADEATSPTRKTAKSEKSAPGWLPPGDAEGDLNHLGGAREVDDTPQRVKPLATDSLPTAARRRAPQVVAPQATPAPVAAPQADDGAGDEEEGIVMEAPASEDPAEPSAPLLEREQGWGVPDWMQAEPEEKQIEYVIDRAQRRLRIDPDDPGAISTLAYYEFLAEDFDGAEKSYDRLIAMFPEDAAAYNNKALIYKRKGDYTREEGMYRLALALDPGDTTALNNLAVNLAHQGKFDEALQIMKELEITLPNDPYSDLHRAKIQASMGNDDAALVFMALALSGAARMDLLHQIEFRQDIRVDPSFARLREDPRFRDLLTKWYGSDSPLGK